jgi:lipopolysaccharide/colanic/teichoic acid biosynthesis glycosyltransferase
MLKRAFDVVSASFGLLLLSPLLLLLGAAVKLTSRGPVFYRGKRTGLHGEPFRIYKFRTMVADAETRGSTATAANDPRITRIGRVLRKYKLDELPQLLNVLNGDMSIVGPRPEVEEHTSVYTAEEQVILTVRPGITDFASIRFRDLGQLIGDDDPNRVFIERYRGEKNRLRIEYVRRRSFLVDLQIIFRTIWCVFVRR